MDKSLNQTNTHNKQSNSSYLSLLMEKSISIYGTTKYLLNKAYVKSKPKASQVYQKTKYVSKNAYEKTKQLSIHAYEKTKTATEYIYENSDKVTSYVVYAYNLIKTYQNMEQKFNKNGKIQLQSGQKDFDSIVYAILIANLSKMILPKVSNIIGIKTLGLLKGGLAAFTESSFFSIASNGLLPTLSIKSLLFGYAPVIIPAVALTYGGYRVYINVMNKRDQQNQKDNKQQQKQVVKTNIQGQRIKIIKNQSQQTTQVSVINQQSNKQDSHLKFQVDITSLQDYLKNLHKYDEYPYKTL